MQKKPQQQVRIIGGHWKRTPLTVVDVPGLRPTPDRVRETLFNWLNFLFQSNWDNKRCLDLFAGSGALGFEAASRGAVQVTIVEAHPLAVGQLEKARDKLKAQQIRIIRGDALMVAQKMAVNCLESVVKKGEKSEGKFDVIFLDPPFHHDILTKVLPVCAPLLDDNGCLYLEAEKALTAEDLPDSLKKWQVLRSDRAGKVYFHLLHRGSQ